MLALRTSLVKNINIDINYQDLVVFIETSFHKKEMENFPRLGIVGIKPNSQGLGFEW